MGEEREQGLQTWRCWVRSFLETLDPQGSDDLKLYWNMSHKSPHTPLSAKLSSKTKTRVYIWKIHYLLLLPFPCMDWVLFLDGGHLLTWSHNQMKQITGSPTKGKGKGRWEKYWERDIHVWKVQMRILLICWVALQSQWCIYDVNCKLQRNKIHLSRTTHIPLVLCINILHIHGGNSGIVDGFKRSLPQVSVNAMIEQKHFQSQWRWPSFFFLRVTKIKDNKCKYKHVHIHE